MVHLMMQKLALSGTESRGCVALRSHIDSQVGALANRLDSLFKSTLCLLVIQERPKHFRPPWRLDDLLLFMFITVTLLIRILSNLSHPLPKRRRMYSLDMPLSVQPDLAFVLLRKRFDGSSSVFVLSMPPTTTLLVYCRVVFLPFALFLNRQSRVTPGVKEPHSALISVNETIHLIRRRRQPDRRVRELAVFGELFCSLKPHVPPCILIAFRQQFATLFDVTFDLRILGPGQTPQFDRPQMIFQRVDERIGPFLFQRFVNEAVDSIQGGISFRRDRLR
mmetsp:Transcript_34684/g.74970  ORF Transcript_34684/g.74970 Transcript_34684/m.74970 type:complete len:278 (-) Transcript_34684:226-1059(-)